MKEGSIVDNSKNVIEGQFAEVSDIPNESKRYIPLVVFGDGNDSSNNTCKIELTDDNIPAIVLSAYKPGTYPVYVSITNSSSHTLTVTYLDFDNPLTNKVVDTISPSSEKSLPIADTRKYGMGAQYMFMGSPIVVDIAD